MDEKQVMELIKTELKTWNIDQLRVAHDFCSRKLAETKNDKWWLQLWRETWLEITNRDAEARRNAEQRKQGTLQ